MAENKVCADDALRWRDQGMLIRCGNKMSAWKAVKARQLLAALERIGWSVSRQSGSHRTMVKPGWAPVTFAFHDRDEVGAGMLAKSARKPGFDPKTCRS